MTPAQRQQLIALGLNPDLTNDTAQPKFGLATGQGQAQPQQTSLSAQPQIPNAPQPTNDPYQGIMQMLGGGGQASPGIDWNAIASIVHPPSRHLGMGGEDISSHPSGTYDSGGIDWLKAHNDGTNGRVAFDPAAAARTHSDMIAAFAPQAASVVQPLPFTQILSQPMPQNPGYAAPQYPAYSQQVEDRRKKLLAASSGFGLM